MLNLFRSILPLLTCVCLTGGTLAAIQNAVDENTADHLEELRQEARREMALAADDQDLIHLVQLDLQLSDSGDEASDVTCRDILKTLAVSQHPTAVEHVRSVFENEPERRNMAAAALGQATTRRPTDLQDWRYMVRSLTVVHGEDAVSVLTALQRFRVRANKPQWVRQVILIGLQLTPEQQPAATLLLQHWTGVPQKSPGASAWTLADYQKWFAKEHPDQPEAVLPVDSDRHRWTLASLQEEIEALTPAPELMAAGAAAYQKAGCQKCHRRGELGDKFGPDLTSLGWRRQKSEILKAVLYPSHDLDEEYPAVTVVLKDGRTFSGVMSAGSEETMSIISSMAVRQEFARSDIESIVNQKVSNMPEGTLEPLTLDEIRALFVFLTSVDGVPKPHGDEVQ